MVRIRPLLLGDDLCHRDHLRLLRSRHPRPDVPCECRHEPLRPADGAHEPSGANRRGLGALHLWLHRRRCALDRGAHTITLALTLALALSLSLTLRLKP